MNSQREMDAFRRIVDELAYFGFDAQLQFADALRDVLHGHGQIEHKTASDATTRIVASIDTLQRGKPKSKRRKATPCAVDSVPAPGEVGIDYRACCSQCGKRVPVTTSGRYARHTSKRGPQVRVFDELVASERETNRQLRMSCEALTQAAQKYAEERDEANNAKYVALSLAEKERERVTAIAKERDTAEKRAEEAIEYLRNHGRMEQATRDALLLILSAEKGGAA